MIKHAKPGTKLWYIFSWWEFRDEVQETPIVTCEACSTFTGGHKFIKPQAIQIRHNVPKEIEVYAVGRDFIIWRNQYTDDWTHDYSREVDDLEELSFDSLYYTEPMCQAAIDLLD